MRAVCPPDLEGDRTRRLRPMTDQGEQLDPMEQGLKEMRAADSAGVFRTTGVDAHALLRHAPDSSPAHSRIFAVRRLAVAAAVLIAVSVFGWVFSRQGAETPSQFIGTELVAAASFSDCVAGPADAAVAGCDPYDYDADGDVDLADISSHQLAYASVNH